MRPYYTAHREKYHLIEFLFCWLTLPRLVDVATLYRLAAAGVVDEPMAHGAEMLFLLLLPRRYAHTVDSTATLVLHHFVRGFRQVVPVVDLVDSTVKDSLHLTPLLCQKSLCALAVPLLGSGSFSLGTCPCPQRASLSTSESLSCRA